MDFRFALVDDDDRADELDVRPILSSLSIYIRQTETNACSVTWTCIEQQRQHECALLTKGICEAVSLSMLGEASAVLSSPLNATAASAGAAVLTGPETVDADSRPTSTFGLKFLCIVRFRWYDSENFSRLILSRSVTSIRCCR
jgi:hypothetical protein